MEECPMKHDPLTTHGAFCWNELITRDVPAAKKFYSQLFGWSLEDMPFGDATYTIVKVKDEEVGGMMQTPPHCAGGPPFWGIYVTVDNVDQTAKKAQELGAKIIVPLTDVPGVGRFFMFQDPQGAMISAMTHEKKA